MLNGGLTVAQHAVNWPTLLGVAGVASLAWLAVLENRDLDRMGAKPLVARH